MKTTYKRVVSLLMALTLCCGMFILPLAADVNQQIGDVVWYYSVSNGEATVSFAENVRGDVTVPSTLGGYPVTAIGLPGFKDNKTIGVLTLPEGMKTVADGALSGTYITGLNLPASLQNFGMQPHFYDCRNINVAPGNSVYASVDGVLFTKDMETMLKYPDYKPGNSYTIPEGVKTLASHAICYCPHLWDLILPESLEVIQSNAFHGFYLGAAQKYNTTLRIPANVRSIALDAFASETLHAAARITVDPANAYYCDVDGVLFNKDKTTLIKCPPRLLFDSDNKNYTVPDSVTTIARHAIFLWGAETITIPKTVTNMTVGFPRDFDNYTVLICDENSRVQQFALETNTPYTFRNSSDPMDPHGPYYEDKYKYIVVNGKAQIISNIDLLKTTKTVAIPAKLGGYPVESIGASAFFSGTLTPYVTETVSIPEGVKSIGTLAFRFSSVVKALYLPNSLESLGKDWIMPNYNGTIYCNNDTYAHKWAHENGYNHVVLDLAEGETDDYEPPHDPVAKSLKPSEVFSFANADGNFTPDEYFTTDADFLKLRNNAKALYKAESAYPVLNAMQNMRYNEWNGSCYGMSLSAILNKTGQINFTKNFAPGADALTNVGKPIDNPAAESAINYYQISQTIPYLRSSFYGPVCGGSTMAEGLEEAVALAQQGKMMLFNYWFSFYGHSVVVHGYEAGPNGGHNLIAWDNRYPGKDVIVYVSKNFERCVVNGVEAAWGVEFETNFKHFDKIDIDGAGNSYAQAAEDPQQLGGAILGVTAAGDFTITGEDGKKVSFDSESGTFSGDMDVKDMGFIVNSTPDGSPAPATFQFTVAQGAAYTFTSATALDVEMISEELYAAAKSKAADAITLDPNAGISVLGSGPVDFRASIGVNNGQMDMVTASGTAQGDTQVSRLNDGVLVESDTDAKVALTVFSNAVDVEELAAANPSGSLLVKENGSGEVTVQPVGEQQHTHNYGSPIVTPPTCTEQGFTTSACDCGDSQVANYVGALGHEWGEWKTTTPATAYAGGVETRTCKHDPTHQETRLIPQLALETKWWEELPMFLQWILRILAFGFIWMN